MILFVYGPETYLVHEKIRQIVDKAKEQGLPESGLIKIDAESAGPEEIASALNSPGLFTERQVVVVRDLLSRKTAEQALAVVDGIGEVPETLIAVFAEYGQPDRRRSAFRKLKDLAQKSWEFGTLDESAARRWVTTYAKRRGIRIAAGASNKLVTMAGTDLWTLSSELDKLANAGDEITERTVEELVTPEVAGDIFVMVDSLGRKQVAPAVGAFKALLDAGEPPLRILAMVVRQYRILIGVHSLAEQGQPDQAIGRRLAGSVGNLPPFVIRKARQQAGLFTAVELRENFEQLADIDFDVKTGRREAETALELFIVETCRPKTRA